MEYQLHLTLWQRAALRIAISFWDRKEVQNKVTAFFKSSGKFLTYKTRYEWHKLTKSVLDEWNKDLLPQNLEVELIHIVKMIGETIFNWFQYTKHDYEAEEEAINCIDRIHWTPYGTLDTIKIFKTYWLSNPNFDITKLYRFACSHSLIEHIDDLYHKFPQNIHVDNFLNMYVNFDRHILAYWKNRRDDDLPNLLRCFEEIARDFNRHDREVFDLIYDLDRSLEENMLRLSVYQGYFIATKYFWEKITEEERNSSVLECARIAVMRYNYNDNNNQNIGGHNRSQYIEILICLMNQMTKDHKKIFFNEKIQFNRRHDYYVHEDDIKDGILGMLLSTWPWQELFIPVLKNMLQYLDDNSRMNCKFLDKITYKMIEEHRLGYVFETSRYRSLLREAWLIVPASIKVKIVDKYSEIDFICNLVNVWDMDSLKFILHDPGIADVRDLFIYGGWESYEEFVMNDQFEKLDQLIEEIAQSEEDKKSFKELIDNWLSLILARRFDLADKLLDWRCSTPEERKSTKSSIDHIEICEILIEINDYDLMDKFLDWQFDTEERKNGKNYFKSDNSSIMQVFSIWSKNKHNIEKAKQDSSRFLSWVLESKEEIELFKKETLVNFERNELITFFLDGLTRIGITDDFLFWCLSDGEQVQRIKRVLSQLNQRP